MIKLVLPVMAIFALAASGPLPAIMPPLYDPPTGYMKSDMTVIYPARFRHAATMFKGDWIYAGGTDEHGITGMGYLNLRTGQSTGFRFGAVEMQDYPFRYGLAPASDGSGVHWGYIDDHGEWVIPPQYVIANRFDASGTASVQTFKDGNFERFTINRKGARLARPIVAPSIERKPHVEAVYPDLPADVHVLWDIGSSGLVVRDDRKKLLALADRRGKLKTPLEFSDMRPFFHGLAIAEKEGRTGAIDENGKWVIDPTFRKMTSFGRTGFSQAWLDGTFDYAKGPSVIVDRTGRVVDHMPDGICLYWQEESDFIAFTNDPGHSCH